MTRPAMSRRILPLAALCLLLVTALSGCFGYPEGTVRPGDRVLIVYDVVDLESGQTVQTNQTATFVVGDGRSILGPEGEQDLLGRPQNDTVTRSVTTFGQQMIPQDPDLPSTPLQDDYPLSQVQSAVPGNLSVGVIFPAGDGINATIVALTSTQATVRFLITDGQLVPFEEFGIYIRYNIDADSFFITLEPMVGTVFSLPQPHPIGLPEGHFRTAGAQDGNIVYDYSPDAPDFDRHLLVKATILGREAGPAPPADGTFGDRNSSVVFRQPSRSAAPPAHADDGHGH